MKIYREVKCSERLPNEEYLLNGKLFFVDRKSVPDNKSTAWYNYYWLHKEWKTGEIINWYEPIEIELDSEKILPKKERMGVCSISDDFTYVKKEDYVQAIKALEVAELKIIELQSKIEELEGTLAYINKLEKQNKEYEEKELKEISKDFVFKTAKQEADERYNKVIEYLSNFDCPKIDINQALKIAAYGTDK